MTYFSLYWIFIGLCYADNISILIGNIGKISNHFQIFLFSLFPYSIAFITVNPFKSSGTVFKTILVSAFESIPIRPSEFSLSVHLEILPMSHILRTVFPLVFTIPLNSIVFEFSLINISTFPLKFALNILHSILKHSSISPVNSLLHSLSILLIFPPLSPKNNTIIQIVRTIPLSWSLLPLPLISLPILLNVPSLSWRLAINPITLIGGTIRPESHPRPLHHFPLHSSHIDQFRIILVELQRTVNFLTFVTTFIFKIFQIFTRFHQILKIVWLNHYYFALSSLWLKFVKFI